MITVRLGPNLLPPESSAGVAIVTARDSVVVRPLGYLEEWDAGLAGIDREFDGSFMAAGGPHEADHDVVCSRANPKTLRLHTEWSGRQRRPITGLHNCVMLAESVRGRVRR